MRVKTVPVRVANLWSSQTALAMPVRPSSGLHRYQRAQTERKYRSGWLERGNKRLSRTDIVGVFPNLAVLLRRAGCVLIEVHDEWQVSERRHLLAGLPLADDQLTATPGTF